MNLCDCAVPVRVVVAAVFPPLYVCSVALMRFTAPLTCCLNDVYILFLKRAKTGVRICIMTFLFSADVC